MTNTKSMIIGAAIAIVSAVIVALCVGRPKVLVEAPVTNSYSITNNVNNLSPITNTYTITNSVSYSISNAVANTYSITNGVSCIVTNNILDRARGFGTTIDGMKVQEEESKERTSAYAALFAINHVNWVVTKIKNYNDPAVLEEEYKNITADALDLNAIKDQEVIDLICDIMDVITEMRIEEKERAMLKEELDQGMSDAIYDAFSGISAGGGLTPASMVFNVISSAATAGMNYKRAKRQLMKTYKKQTWALDKNRMKYLNDLNKSLLRKYWTLVQRYGVPDEMRVSEKDIALLIDHLKDTDQKRLYSFLRTTERKYLGLQNYWYYRGLMAQQCKDDTDAKQSLDLYQKMQREYGKMLRIDGIAAKAAMLRVQLMIQDKVTDEEKYREQLSIIEKNSTIEEWQQFYFCALVYASQLKDIDAAERVLLPTINHLDFLRTQRLVDWQSLVDEKREHCGTNSVASLVQSGDALFECRTLLVKVAKDLLSPEKVDQKLSEICDNAGASAREKLFCYCAMGYNQAIEKLVPDLRRMRVIIDGGRLKMSLPMSWVISREGESRLSVSTSDSFSSEMDFSSFETLRESDEERTIEEREDGNYALVDFGKPSEKKISGIKKFVYTMRFDRNGSSAGKGGKSYMVAVEFNAAPGQNSLAPKKAYFGVWRVAEGYAEESGWDTPEAEGVPNVAYPLD